MSVRIGHVLENTKVSVDGMNGVVIGRYTPEPVDTITGVTGIVMNKMVPQEQVRVRLSNGTVVHLDSDVEVEVIYGST